MGDISANIMLLGIFRHSSGCSKIIPLPAATTRNICLMIIDDEEEDNKAEEEAEDKKKHCKSSSQ